jgi:hypothetical protein
MNGEMRELHGACYCGNIRFSFQTALSDEELPRRECQCSFCLQHGRISTSDPDGRLRVAIGEEKDVNRFRFGHGTADFYVCRVCGGIPVVTSEIDGALRGLVDVRMIEDFAWSRSDAAPHDFEGEEVAARLDRRRGYWFGAVEFD